MSLIDQFRYDGKRVLVVGGATGMGAAAAKASAELGAEVIVMDRAPVDYPVDQEITVDLSDQASIDAALEQLDGPVNAIFSAAGVADGPAGPQILMRINFIGHRHLIERLLADGRLAREGCAHQRHLSGAYRHPTESGQRRPVAGLRAGLSGSHRYRHPDARANGEGDGVPQ
jgi:NAD(P)-dependent dehydrogenase (short-subunit alcohol dehydrogenase family)